INFPCSFGCVSASQAARLLPVNAGRGECASPRPAAGALVGTRTPDQGVAVVRHMRPRHAVERRTLDLRRRPPLDLEDAVAVVPPACAPVPVVATARRNGVRALDANVCLVEVEGVAPLLPARGEPEALKVELVEEGESVVHVLERQVIWPDAGALVEDPPHPVACPFPLIERGLHALELWPGLTVAQDVCGLRLVV